MKSADVLIVGSGMAGVSAAFPLVETGVDVVMADGGRSPKVPVPEAPLLQLRRSDPDQWKWEIGESFHALREMNVVSPKLRAPTLDYVFSDFIKENKIRTNNFFPVGSLSTGGLSNAWGCEVARYTGEEMANFPFSADEIDSSYTAVSRRIGISGKVDDDLSSFFAVDEWADSPLPKDSLHRCIYKRYSSSRDLLVNRGFRIGHPRMAVLSRDHAGRNKCGLSGNCVFGCARRAMYSASYELPELMKWKNFRHFPGFVVRDIWREGSEWIAEGTRIGVVEKIAAKKVILAAGTLATTRLLLQTLKIGGSIPLHAAPTAAFLLWIPRFLGAPRERSFGMAQLSFSMRTKDGLSAYGSTFGTSGIFVSDFVRHVPLRRRHGIDLLGAVLSSCVVGNIFLPGNLSSISVSLDKEKNLFIESGQSLTLGPLMRKIRGELRWAFSKLGAILVPMSFVVGAPGADIHYSTTFPMAQNPRIGQTDSRGEVVGLSGVFVADGACLPPLPPKPSALTIMANANRIGMIVGRILRSC